MNLTIMNGIVFEDDARINNDKYKKIKKLLKKFISN